MYVYFYVIYTLRKDVVPTRMWLYMLVSMGICGSCARHPISIYVKAGEHMHVRTHKLKRKARKMGEPKMNSMDSNSCTLMSKAGASSPQCSLLYFLFFPPISDIVLLVI